MSDVIETARAWLAEDPDPDTRAELEALLEADDREGLADRFAGLLQFGTAGLRGELGAGPNRMNRAVVIRAAAGLAAYLKTAYVTDTVAPPTTRNSVVIGFDARHKSDAFARDTAAVLEAAGLHALVLPRPLPTPVLAFAIRRLGCVAGVMVTASHNPPADNGYKVYLGDGSQIVPPADEEIARHIAAVRSLADVPLAQDGWETLGDALIDSYLERAVSVVDPDGPRDVRIVHTAMHGVGTAVMLGAFDRAGFADVRPVPEQADPDPDFPTVAFPNPEEPGAMDLAFRTARAEDADLVIANDPDADRCAVAVPDPTAGGWRMLRGDEVGALLGAEVARRGTIGVLATTIVSSSLLGAIARDNNIAYVETLTGFKWLARVPGLAFAYEEALGYCVDPAGVCDKDGVTAALMLAESAAGAKRDGRTLLDLLDEVATRYGLYSTDQYSVRVDRLDLIAKAMERLRADSPTSLGGLAVARAEDLLHPEPGALPPTDGLRYVLAGDGEHILAGRVVVRPSGTEPKLKAYLEVVVDPTHIAEVGLPVARAAAFDALENLKRDLAGTLGI
nr:phospho-sugar mutase [Streptomyces sp. SID3343]